MLKEKIDENLSDKFKYLEVDAWGLSKESLQQGILENINSQLDDFKSQQDIEDELYNVKEVESINYKKTFRNFLIAWGLIAGIGEFAALFDNS